MNRLRKFTIVFALLLGALAAMASDECVVEGTYTYVGSDTEGPKQCKDKALAGAKVAALQEKFGTIISNVTLEQTRINNDRADEYFDALTLSDVKGEWIADLGEPKFQISYNQQGNLVVTCTVKGRAKPLSNEAVEFEMCVMRNAPDKRMAESHFKSGDQMFMSFKAPVDGYLSVYLLGADQQVCALFPYHGCPTDEVKVKKGVEYMLFAPGQTPAAWGEPDELILSTDDVEQNHLYVIFSPKSYSRPVDTASGQYAPSTLSFRDFTRWLDRVRKADSKMAVKIHDIVIEQ